MRGLRIYKVEAKLVYLMRSHQHSPVTDLGH
jgi:hypothetical protein